LATATSSAPARINLTFATLILLINYIGRYILSGELSLIQQKFHATRAQLGGAPRPCFSL
jgi:hypothetical protein